MNSKWYLVIAASFGIIFLAYQFLSKSGSGYLDQNNQGKERGESTQAGHSSPGSAQMNNPGLERHTPGPNVVVVEPGSNHLETFEVIERLENLKHAPDEEGLSFARWALLSGKYSQDDKEKIFNSAVQFLPTRHSSMLARDMLVMGGIPDLYPKAIAVHTQGMSQQQLGNFLREVSKDAKDEKLKDVLEEFASSHSLKISQ